MTQRNKWKVSPPQARYNAFKDLVALNRVEVPESGFHAIFVMKIPSGLKPEEKEERLYQPHRFKPDSDNLLKALYDAVHKEDSHIWDARVSKIWGRTGKIIIIEGIETPWMLEFVKENLEK